MYDEGEDDMYNQYMDMDMGGNTFLIFLFANFCFS